MRLKPILTGFSMLALGACATGLSKDECLYADWRAIGYEDGARGAAASSISSHRRACAKKAGVTPDMNAYLAGREAGLQQFCRPSNAFSLGARGGVYHGVCKGDAAQSFDTAYQSGYELHRLESDLARAGKALRYAEKEIEDVGYAIAEAEAALVAPATPHEDRIVILADLKNLHDKKATLEDSLGPLAVDVRAAQGELDDYRAHLAVNGPYPGATATGVTNARY